MQTLGRLGDKGHADPEYEDVLGEDELLPCPCGCPCGPLRFSGLQLQEFEDQNILRESFYSFFSSFSTRARLNPKQNEL